jgi:hypothetical protein
MSQINTEFGRGNNLNSYRGTTYYTSSGGPFTFPSGAISFSNFYGTQATSPTFSFTIAANLDQANLRTLAINAGWNGSAAVVATFAAGYWIYSSTTGAAALTIDGSWPNGVTFINNGYVVGMGGAGGTAPTLTGSAGGGGGGTALALGAYVTIYNYGYIAGGGGGGGSGGTSSLGTYAYYRGGGGGGGQTGLQNSSGGGGFNAGGSGTSGGAGGGGAGQLVTAGQYYGGNGGSGGGWGASGAAGSAGFSTPTTYPGGAGGGGGLCTSGKGYISWAVTGNRYGGLG